MNEINAVKINNKYYYIDQNFTITIFHEILLKISEQNLVLSIINIEQFYTQNFNVKNKNIKLNIILRV